MANRPEYGPAARDPDSGPWPADLPRPRYERHAASRVGLDKVLEHIGRGDEVVCGSSSGGPRSGTYWPNRSTIWRSAAQLPPPLGDA
jgi:hypothetical protein